MTDVLPAVTVTEPQNFAAACRQVLAVLRSRVGFDSWFITRVQDGQLLALATLGWTTDGQAPARICTYEDSCCHLMLTGAAPRCAPDVHAIEAYHNATIFKTLSFGAYVGVPLWAADGSVLGTLCAVNATPVPPSIERDMPLIELQADLLSMLLSAELEADRNRRRAEQAETASTHDALTGLHNRRAWDVLLASEDTRCQRYAHAACVVSIDLDELKTTNDTLGHAFGDRLLCRAAAAIKGAVRDVDTVARLGGDEFAVLAPECDTAGSAVLVARLTASLDAADVRASMGVGHRDVQGSLPAAADVADAAMYRVKRARKAARAHADTGDDFVAV